MCCIVALMGLIGPRVAFLFAWIFTDEVDQAYRLVLDEAAGPDLPAVDGALLGDRVRARSRRSPASASSWC